MASQDVQPCERDAAPPIKVDDVLTRGTATALDDISQLLTEKSDTKKLSRIGPTALESTTVGP